MSNIFERKDKIIKKSHQLMEERRIIEEAVTEAEKIKADFLEELEIAQKYKLQRLLNYREDFEEEYSVDEMEKEFEAKRERFYELVKEILENGILSEWTHIYSRAIDVIIEEQELSELQKFKEYIISCYEDNLKKGYVVKTFEIELMSDSYWQNYFSKNRTPRLMGTKLTMRDVYRSNSDYANTINSGVNQIYITPKFKNADETTERKCSRKVPILSILSQINLRCYMDNDSASDNINYLIEIVKRYGKKKEYDYCEDSGIKHATYILDEFLKIEITQSFFEKNGTYLKVSLIE